MVKNNVKQSEIEKISPYPPPPPPAVVNIPLEQLRRLYGDNYGTSGSEVIKATPDFGNTSQLAVLTWVNECEKADGNPIELLKQGIDILKKGYADFNSFKHLFGRYDAEWAIHLGSNLLQMKVIAKKAGHKWEAWAAENLPFIGKRNRINFMNLAKRTDCHQYSFLGVDRLSILCTATSDSKDGDPIGSFLEKHEISFNPATEFDLNEFKLQVDTALNRERLLKSGIDIDAKKVKALTVVGKTFEKSFVQKIKDISESGGDLNVFLDKVTMSGGQESLGDEGEKRLQDFSTLSNRLIATIDYIVTENEDEIEKINPETFSRLLKKLAILQKLGNFTEPIAKAA